MKIQITILVKGKKPTSLTSTGVNHNLYDGRASGSGWNCYYPHLRISASPHLGISFTGRNLLQKMIIRWPEMTFRRLHCHFRLIYLRNSFNGKLDKRKHFLLYDTVVLLPVLCTNPSYDLSPVHPIRSSSLLYYSLLWSWVVVVVLHPLWTRCVSR